MLHIMLILVCNIMDLMMPSEIIWGSYVFVENYRKTRKYSDTWNIPVIVLKFEPCGSTIE